MTDEPAAAAAPLHGLLLVDKPPGPSSAQAIGPIKYAAGKSCRVGHAGTLDPFASGALIVLLGDATRLQRFAMALPKTYVADVLFGVETTTLDPEGEVARAADPGPWRPRDLEAALRRFEGAIEQVPPAYSALKVGGRRAYQLARKGEAPAMKARTVRVDGIHVVQARWPRVRLRVTCGAGTYLRALARDIGDALGVPASLEGLCRTAIGPFDIAGDSALEITGSAPRALLAERAAPCVALTEAAGLATIPLGDDDAHEIAHGRSLPAPPALDDGSEVALTRPSAPRATRLLAIAQVRAGRLVPKPVLSDARADVLGEPRP